MEVKSAMNITGLKTKRSNLLEEIRAIENQPIDNLTLHEKKRLRLLKRCKNWVNRELLKERKERKKRYFYKRDVNAKL